MRRTGLVFVAAALLLVMVLPAAESTHTYGHRYLVMGRVLDEAGNPVQQQSVRITTMLGSTVHAEIVAQTDCQGSFFSPDGQAVPRGEQRYEQSQADGKLYFHYHDGEMSRQIDVELEVLGETWTEDFNPDTRYTAVRHRLTQAAAPADACGGYDAFNNTFTLHVSMFTERELQTNAEDVVNQRAMNATLTHANGTTLVNGTTDISGNVFFDFENVIVSAGDTIVVLSEAIDDQTLTLADDDVAFRWRDETSTIKGDPGPLIGSGLRNFLILLAAVVVIVLAYMGYQKVRQKQELKKAYQQTERKRARRKP